MTAPRVTVVSDTHLSPATPEAQSNWEAVLRHVAETAPDLVVHVGGTRHVWAPTTWAVLPDDVQPPVGLKRCGVVTLELYGSPAVEPVLVEPPGLAQLMLWRDLADPYSRH